MDKPHAIASVLTITMILIIISTAQAADMVFSDACSLADVITAANTDAAVGDCPAGDGAEKISLSSDITLDAALPQITSEVTIEGGGFTISGRNRFRIFVVNGGTLTVNNLTLTKGKSDWGGAIVNVNGGTVVVRSSKISSSQSLEGGAIGNEATLNIINSELTDNSAEFGGALHITGGTLNITDSSITGNSSTDDGGAIWCENSAVIISDSTLTQNDSDASGGAIWSENSTMIISDSTLTQNDSDGSGGAIRMDKAELKITGSVLSGNRSGYLGGAIYTDAYYAKLYTIIENTQLRENVAEDGGGALAHWGGIIGLVDSIISDNRVNKGGRSSEGGGIYTFFGQLTVDRSTISHNEADIGGGIYTSGGVISFSSHIIRNSQLFNNRAREEGGALYAESEYDKIVFTHVTVVGNQAVQGGGLYRLSDATIELVNSIISGSLGGDCYGRLAEKIGSLIADGSCFAALSGDPMLGDLVEPEDGSPSYYPLQEGSPAIDAADSLFCPDTDIVGTERPQGSACDIGAYELPQ